MQIWLTHKQSSGELTRRHRNTYEQGHEHLLLFTAVLPKLTGSDFSIGSSATVSLDAWDRAANLASSTPRKPALAVCPDPIEKRRACFRAFCAEH